MDSSDRLDLLLLNAVSPLRHQPNRQNDHKKTALKRQIDALVFDLDGLTEDEIRIAREATGSPFKRR